MAKQKSYEAKLKADLDAKYQDRQAKITAYEMIVEAFETMLRTEKRWQVKEHLIQFYNEFYENATF